MKTLVQLNWFNEQHKYNFYLNPATDFVLSERYIDVMPLFKVEING